MEGGEDRFPNRPSRGLSPCRLTCGNGPALDFICPPGEISEGLNTALQVHKKGMKEWLASVHGLQRLQGQDGAFCGYSFLFSSSC